MSSYYGDITPEQVEALYVKLIHEYIDQRKYPKEQANRIVQTIIKREIAMRNPLCQ